MGRIECGMGMVADPPEPIATFFSVAARKRDLLLVWIRQGAMCEINATVDSVVGRTGEGSQNECG